MEAAANGFGEGKRKPGKLTMEDYLLFVDNNKCVNLTIDQLNQIIDLHGFKKNHNVPKRILYEAVQSMEMMNLSRSTLRGHEESSWAVMSLDDIIEGLTDLGWQECRVTSLQMFSSVSVEPHHLDGVANCSGSALAAASGSSSVGKQPKRRNKLISKQTDVCSISDNNGSGDANASRGGSESAPCVNEHHDRSGTTTKSVTKRKRSPRAGDNGGADLVAASASLPLGCDGN